MASLLNPYLSFQDEARQAMEFYQQVFGGELTISTFGEYGMADTPQADLVMHAQLETPSGYTLMGSDTPPGMEYTSGTQITVSLSGDDAEQLRSFFNQLAEGGTVLMPLEKQMWGDEYGACVDKFGIPWMANISSGS
ncbi:MAG: VOC family protein [Propionibacteriaceae bacterium]